MIKIFSSILVCCFFITQDQTDIRTNLFGQWKLISVTNSIPRPNSKIKRKVKHEIWTINDKFIAINGLKYAYEIFEKENSHVLDIDKQRQSYYISFIRKNRLILRTTNNPHVYNTIVFEKID